MSSQPYLNPYHWRQPISSPRWLTWHSIWRKRERGNLYNHHDNYGVIDDDTEENVLCKNEYFDGFDNNGDVISKSDEAYIDVLNKFTGIRNGVDEFFVGEDWYQDIDDYVEDYTIPLVGLIRYYYWETPLGLSFRRIQRLHESTVRATPWCSEHSGWLEISKSLGGG